MVRKVPTAGQVAVVASTCVIVVVAGIVARVPPRSIGVMLGFVLALNVLALILVVRRQRERSVEPVTRGISLRDARWIGLLVLAVIVPPWIAILARASFNLSEFTEGVIWMIAFLGFVTVAVLLRRG